MIPAGRLARWFLWCSVLWIEIIPAWSQVRIPGLEDGFLGTIEVANRWRTFDGNEDLYRSMVDLGEGPKLNAFRLQYREVSPESGHPLLDAADIQLTGWGGEPASTLRVDWSRAHDYEASVRYRRFAYFNRIPTFANPTSGFQGAAQQWLDIDRGLFDAEITVRPRATMVPFFRVSRDSGQGPGRTTFVEDANEYAVSSITDTYTNTFQGGLKFRFRKWTATLEGGTSAFDDSQSLQFSGDTEGNRTALFLGRRLRLTDLNQSYRIRGSNRFVTVRLEARPVSEIGLFGRFAFSQPATTLTYSQTQSGEFVLLETLAAFSQASAVGAGESNRPRPSGTAGVEYRPIPQLRIVESVSFEGFHVSGVARTESQFSNSSVSSPVEEAGTGRLESRWTRNRLDATFEFNRRFSVHGGHTYLTATARSDGSRLSPAEERSIDRHETTAGFTTRPTEHLELRTEFEIVRGDNVYFRTDRREYERVMVRGRYRITDELTTSIYGTLWNNTNTLSNTTIVNDELAQRDRRMGGDLAYAPQAGWLGAVFAAYERSTFTSDVGFLIPQNFQPATSVYQERGHSGTITVLIRPEARVELDLGGRLFISTDESDSGVTGRPTRFYDSRFRLNVGLSAGWTWNGEWRRVEYANRSLASEAFQTHLIATGLTYMF